MFMSNFKTDVEPFSRQYLSYIRNLIQPKLFKDINHNFLCNINIFSIILQVLIHYKGFFLYGCDGSDEKLPDFPEVREEFNIKNTLKYTKPCMGKLSTIQDVLNGFILDGILGNYKQGELPLMHQNLSNIKNMIIPEKSIFVFDRNL